MLGNSEKYITLGTSKFNGILKVCFSGTGNSRIQEIWDLRSLEFADVQSSGNLVRRRDGVVNMRKPGISTGWRPEVRRFSDSGIQGGLCSGLKRQDVHESAGKRKPIRESVEDINSGTSGEDIRESREKQSQSCSPKKSGFRV
jgi:hypothetical protein